MGFPTPVELAQASLTYTSPTPEQKVRHGRAADLLTELGYRLVSETGAAAPSFQVISSAVNQFVGGIFEIAAPDVDFPCVVGNRAYPEGTEVVRCLSRVRMCATWAAGAASPTGDRADWSRELCSAMRSLELAIATAITVTP